MKTAILLFAHGSRDPLWHAPLQAIQQRLQTLAPGVQVRLAYLELTLPDLPTCAAELIGQGTQRLRILPMFLGMGRHAREDLPELIAQLRAQHPDVVLEVLPALGENPSLIDLTCQIALNELN
jgi:sirohydrochlorin cobaltochelatase